MGYLPQGHTVPWFCDLSTRVHTQRADIMKTENGLPPALCPSASLSGIILQRTGNRLEELNYVCPQQAPYP